MSNARRTFIKSMATAGAVSTLPIAGSVLASGKKDTEALAGTDITPFRQAMGDSVQLTDADGNTHNAKIVEVDEIRHQCAMHQRPAYVPECAHVVRFEVEIDEALRGDLYQLKHPALGKMNLLLSAVPNKQGTVGLEAVFN